jgi:hypothetical protein
MSIKKVVPYFCVLRERYISYLYGQDKSSARQKNHVRFTGKCMLYSLCQLILHAFPFQNLKRGKFHNLSISCQLDLFDKVVKPILLYGCELWGLSNCDIIERVHLKFFILDFNQTSLMKICVSQIYEKPHSSKIVFTLFNQEKFAFCVLHKWYIKRCITEQMFYCFPVIRIMGIK